MAEVDNSEREEHVVGDLYVYSYGHPAATEVCGLYASWAAAPDSGCPAATTPPLAGTPIFATPPLDGSSRVASGLSRHDICIHDGGVSFVAVRR
ncbi:hypothetical protein E2562_017421 [Oryza meyeriana var. granulata]|uniref:Uncharacterized protein n=1 Tax=Oryza meyeriana var. granulata TaxID=110450 RepID=A0A6G1D513_9ORYZ|nr:hypothetical protein E2562_017421 [Oryza meyeriana var. granulata]